MAIKVYNTLTKQKEVFEPTQAGKVGIYLCGPTVYKKSHIGHAVGPVIFDTIRRWLTAVHGYEVTLVVNVTDVDDKLIVAANEQSRETAEIADEVLDDYLKALASLNVQPFSAMPKATERIDDIVALVQALIDRDFAYVVNGDVYFDVSKCPDYGKLSGRTVDEQAAGTRELQSGGDKRHPWDFALWKAAKPGEPSWPSPWGHGRPGWHIECSAMSMKELGETFDIHGGGLDLVFPHHENEIAQSEAATGRPFVKYWLHNGLTRIDTKKMSKSLGNVRSLEELLGQWPGEVLRFFILSTHYRRPIDFSDEHIAKVAKGMQAFYRLFDRVRQITGTDPYQLDTDSQLAQPTAALTKHEQALHAALDDDFNTAEAIASLYDMANAVNRFIEEQVITNQSSEADKSTLLDQVRTVMTNARRLGLFETPPEHAISDDLAESLVQLLIDVRAQARQTRQFALADTIRDRLGELGVQLKDSRDGTTWEKV